MRNCINEKNELTIGKQQNLSAEQDVLWKEISTIMTLFSNLEKLSITRNNIDINRLLIK